VSKGNTHSTVAPLHITDKLELQAADLAMFSLIIPDQDQSSHISK